MRVENKNFILVFGALILVIAFVSLPAHAQTYGGSSSSALYSTTNSSVFQAPGGIQQGGASDQAGSSAAILQQVGATNTVLVVSGAPSVQAAIEPSDTMSNNKEVIWLSIFAAAFALGVLYLLSRQIKRSY